MTPQSETGTLLSGLRTVADGSLSAATNMPPAMYHSEAVLALEQERVFGRDWVSPGLAAEIPEVGDEYTGMRIGGKMAIDATKPPTWRTAERQKFSRVDPMGKGDPEIARILEQVRVPR